MSPFVTSASLRHRDSHSILPLLRAARAEAEDAMFTTIFTGMAWLGVLLPPIGDTARPTLIVRTYNTIGVAPQELRAARATVRAILSDGMIDLVWRDCEICGFDSRGAAGV